MGLEAIYRKPKTAIPKSGDHIYPYLLKDLQIERVNQVWATDITYLPIAKGFAYRWRAYVPCCDYRPLQPKGNVMAVVKYDGCIVLHRDAGRCNSKIRPAGNL